MVFSLTKNKELSIDGYNTVKGFKVYKIHWYKNDIYMGSVIAINLFGYKIEFTWKNI